MSHSNMQGEFLVTELTKKRQKPLSISKFKLYDYENLHGKQH